jgi:hypothetical protein
MLLTIFFSIKSLRLPLQSLMKHAPTYPFASQVSNDIPPQPRRRPDPLGHRCCVYNWDLHPLDLGSGKGQLTLYNRHMHGIFPSHLTSRILRAGSRDWPFDRQELMQSGPYII